MPAAVYILFGAAFTVAVCMAAGSLLVSRLRLPFDREEHWLFSFLLGSVLVSTLTFLLCASHLAHKGVFLVVGLALLVLAWKFRAPAHPDSLPRCAMGPAVYGALIIAAAYLVLYFVNAMAPEISPDGSSYHLGLVARYLRAHGFPRITTNMYANLSQGAEMLFLFAFAFGRHSAAAMVHFAFLLALPVAMLLYARRSGFLAAGVCAALFVFASPLVGIDGISAYIDVAVAAIAFGVFYLLEIWDTERHAGLLVAIGLLAGFAYAVKYTAALAIPYALAFVAWRSWRARKPVLRPVLVVALCAAAVMSPWIVKNTVWLQNPFSPFLNAWFPNPYVHVGFEREYSRDMRHYDSIQTYGQLPWALAVDGRLAGSFGPLFLLAPVGLLALKRRAGRHLLLGALVFGVTYFLNIGARFLIPALPFLAMAMALVFIRWKPLAIALVLAHAVFSWPPLTSLYCSGAAWRLTQIPIRAALRIEPEDVFLDANLSLYRMARLVERTTPPGATILAMTALPEAYTTRNILSQYQAASNQVLGDILWTPLLDPFSPTWMLELRFPAAAVRRIRVRQTAVSPTDQWSISELRVFNSGAELPRSPNWRLHAEPNPWEIQNAFDNTPVTRWRTWLPTDGREFVQVDFGVQETIDRVEVQCSHDQGKIRLQLDGMDSTGQWQPLAAAIAEDLAPPIPGLRRMATEELKLRGVDYLVLFRFDFGTEDLRSHAPEWGVTPVGVQGEDRLYKLN